MRTRGITIGSAWASLRLTPYRFGGRFGGPILHNRTYFFFEYEGRRYPETFLNNYIVPTSTLKLGSSSSRMRRGISTSITWPRPPLAGPAAARLATRVDWDSARP